MNRNLEIALCELLPHKVKVTITDFGCSADSILTSRNYSIYLDIKPHLRSLSQLTKPIVVEGYNDGKEFVPMEELNREMVSWVCHDYDSVCFHFPNNASTINILSEPHEVISLLKQWHFNVWGLTKDEYIEIK